MLFATPASAAVGAAANRGGEANSLSIARLHRLHHRWNGLDALMGGLPHHSAHHAFPALPSARLPEASARLRAVLEEHGWPLPSRLEGDGKGLAACAGEAGDRAPGSRRLRLGPP
ncbi:MAG: fatty acid desaturase [Cyanobacteriota bacterium]|nr:fatty acid desaturase [Cyanobacteriota bacterium]